MNKKRLRKITQLQSWKRLLSRVLTTRFWKIQFMAFPVFKLFCWATRSLTFRFWPSLCRYVLLSCESVQSAEHLKRFSEVFKNDPRVRFKVMVEAYAKKVPSLYAGVRKFLPFPEVSNLRAYLCEWDMVVVADHSRHQLMSVPRKCPVVYIGHGPQNKSRPRNETTRAYSDFAFNRWSILNFYRKKQPIYSLMLEGEGKVRDLAIETNPSLSDVIVVVGNMVYDSILSQTDRREEFRHRLGIGSNEIAVFVLSTWRPECLIESVGDEFLEESRKLLSEFKFIISVHPNEYVPEHSGQRVWGEYLPTQRKYGYIIREPDEDFIPYMVACDIVLTDHTCLADYAILLQKPTICVPVSHEYIWKGSITWQLYQFAPILNDMRNLREALLKTKSDYPFEKLVRLANSMNPYPGEAAHRISKAIYDLLKLSPPSA